MGTTWLKIKLWTKVIVFSTVALVLVIVLSRNWDTTVPHLDFLFVKYEQPRLLLVLLLTSIFSIFGWWVFRTAFKTMRQMRDVRHRAEVERKARELDEMKAKAAKLQVRPEPSPPRE